jgi:hypothetical protein
MGAEWVVGENDHEIAGSAGLGQNPLGSREVFNQFDHILIH